MEKLQIRIKLKKVNPSTHASHHTTERSLVSYNCTFRELELKHCSKNSRERNSLHINEPRDILQPYKSEKDSSSVEPVILGPHHTAKFGGVWTEVGAIASDKGYISRYQ